MASVAISAGHSKYVRGAQGYLDEFAETSRVVTDLAAKLKTLGVEVYSFIDNTSHDQNTNLNTIVDWHNSQPAHDLDVSVHFNSNGTQSGPIGTEAWYVSSAGKAWAIKITPAVAEAGDLIDRGAKHTDDLFVLNNTEMPCVLIEVCFVSSKADTDLYHSHYDEIISAIAEVLAEESPAEEGLTEIEQNIRKMASNSEIAGYNWPDRGMAPDGYVEGFALAWAQVVKRWYDNDPVVHEMAKANTHDDEVDALSWYNSNFKAAGMSNEKAGLDTLRHLYTLLYSLGMRESSGQHCCGRDQSANNTDGMTCEAGLYQTSYNAHASCPEFDQVMEAYERGERDHKGYLEVFAQDVSCDSANWKCYGSAPGYTFQLLAKNAPAFAVESCALVLRNLRQHYGPINRKEATVEPDAEEMLAAVQEYIEGVEEPPAPEPPSNLEARVTALEQHVATLDSEIVELEDRVTKLEHAVAGIEPIEKKTSKPKGKSKKK